MGRTQDMYGKELADHKNIMLGSKKTVQFIILSLTMDSVFCGK